MGSIVLFVHHSSTSQKHQCQEWVSFEVVDKQGYIDSKTFQTTEISLCYLHIPEHNSKLIEKYTNLRQ